MKTLAFSLPKLRTALSALVCLSAFALFDTAAASAAIVADFSGGNGTETVDQFTGIAGGGWVGGWRRDFNTGVNVSNTTVLKPGDTRYNPLVDGKNYLAIQMRKGSGAAVNAAGAILRQYGDGEGISLTEEHSISFYYRVDSSLESFSSLSIWGATLLGHTPNDRTTWLADISENQTWQFLDGSEAGRLDSDIAVAEGHIYHFTITVNPALNSYSVQLRDLTGGHTFQSDDPLAFRFKSKSAGGYLMFSSIPVVNPDAVTQVDYSVADIIIAPIPEGQTAALLLGGAAALVWWGRRTRASKAQTRLHNAACL